VIFRGFPETITKLEWTIDIPQHFFDLIVVKATYFGFQDIRAYQQGTLKEQIYQWMIKSLATRTTNQFPLKMQRLNNNPNKIW